MCRKSTHGDASGAGTRVIGVEVLVDVHDQVGLRSIKVGNGGKSRGAAVRDESASGGVVIAGEEDHLGGSACLTDGSDSSLNGGSPGLFDHKEVLSTLSLPQPCKEC